MKVSHVLKTTGRIFQERKFSIPFGRFSFFFLFYLPIHITAEIGEQINFTVALQFTK